MMERNVVVAGWGQVTQPNQINTKPLDLMGMMAKAASTAADMMHSKRVLHHLDGIMVVTPGSRNLPSPDKLLADKINAVPQLSLVSGIGGNSPQTLINRAAGMIARGQIDSILIAGAETYVQRENTGSSTGSALFDNLKDYTGDDLIGSTPLENRHGIEHPMHGFPLFETALWAASGKALEPYLTGVGNLWASFSRIASGHPCAWSRTIRTCREIITPTSSNRPIAFPYTKYMNAFVSVDQAAAIILMDEKTAGKYRQKGRQTVYFIGGGYAEDRQRFLIQKSDFTASPPLKAAVDKALHRSGKRLPDIESLDIYSCFPCAVSIAKKMLKIQDDDPRPLSQTGGLGFFGGPGNNYNLHAVATLAEKISQGDTQNGLVTALGWFMHKHAAGVYNAEPSENAFENHDIEDTKQPLVGEPPMSVIDEYTGIGTVDTYTIVYHPDHSPAYAVIYGTADNNRRFIARTPSDPDLYRQLSSTCCVGHQVNVRFDSRYQINIAELI